MDRSDVITLVLKTVSRDSRGVPHVEETKKSVFCSVRSISAAEFHNAGQNGLKPAYKFIMFAYDYENEQIIEYKGERFLVYRTYWSNDDNIELYVQREVGA